jgi:hypothetical protein
VLAVRTDDGRGAERGIVDLFLPVENDRDLAALVAARHVVEVTTVRAERVVERGPLALPEASDLGEGFAALVTDGYDEPSPALGAVGQAPAVGAEEHQVGEDVVEGLGRRAVADDEPLAALPHRIGDMPRVQAEARIVHLVVRLAVDATDDGDLLVPAPGLVPEAAAVRAEDRRADRLVRSRFLVVHDHEPRAAAGALERDPAAVGAESEGVRLVRADVVERGAGDAVHEDRELAGFGRRCRGIGDVTAIQAHGTGKVG